MVMLLIVVLVVVLREGLTHFYQNAERQVGQTVCVPKSYNFQETEIHNQRKMDLRE